LRTVRASSPVEASMTMRPAEAQLVGKVEPDQRLILDDQNCAVWAGFAPLGRTHYGPCPRRTIG
jgi:hypothetical protein